MNESPSPWTPHLRSYGQSFVTAANGDVIAKSIGRLEDATLMAAAIEMLDFIENDLSDMADALGENHFIEMRRQGLIKQIRGDDTLEDASSDSGTEEDPGPPASVSQIKDERDEAIRLLVLILAEWQSDANSVACFDLRSIVKPVTALVVKAQRTHK